MTAKTSEPAIMRCLAARFFVSRCAPGVNFCPPVTLAAKGARTLTARGLRPQISQRPSGTPAHPLPLDCPCKGNGLFPPRASFHWPAAMWEQFGLRVTLFRSLHHRGPAAAGSWDISAVPLSDILWSTLVTASAARRPRPPGSEMADTFHDKQLVTLHRPSMRHGCTPRPCKTPGRCLTLRWARSSSTHRPRPSCNAATAS